MASYKGHVCTKALVPLAAEFLILRGDRGIGVGVEDTRLTVKLAGEALIWHYSILTHQVAINE